VLDLQYKIKLGTRDLALDVEQMAPNSDVNRQYYAQNAAKLITNDASYSLAGKVESAGKELLKKMARQDPYHNPHRMQYCALFAKGSCKRGSSCPYKHELYTESNATTQDKQDLELAILKDLSADTLVRKTKEMVLLTPPIDQSVTSLFLTGVEADLQESDLRDHFYAFGELKSIVMVRRSKCAFVNYVTRAATELAAENCLHGVNLKGHRLRVAWARPKPLGPSAEIKQKQEMSNVPPPPPGTEQGTLHYPSQGMVVWLL
jgi:pre-mRNA-splicing factor RBM22/SLT11